VIYLLKNVRFLYARIVVISNSLLSKEHYKKLSEFSDGILIRKNEGFSFGAWKEAILKDGWEMLSQYDNLTLMSDSCFGPLFDIKNIYCEMESKNNDFWELTNSKNDKFAIPRTCKIIPHIKSYFICFKKDVVSSDQFKIFWRNLECNNKTKMAICKYEIRLSKILTKAGFKYSVFFDTTNFSQPEFDLSVRRPDLCLKFKVPFLRVKAFSVFPYPKYIIKLLQENTTYPVFIIFDYLNRIYDPDTTLLIQDKLIPNKDVNINNLQSKNVAIHLHVYHPDILDKFVLYFNSISIDFDLYITTDISEKRDIIYNYLKNQACFSRLKEIIITKNRGRDIFPWLSIKDRLNQYDIVGHFHTKKASHTEDWFGITWLDDLLDSLLSNVNNIINEFHNDVNLGIVIPEVPYIFRNLALLGFSANLNKISNNLWKKLKCHKQINFKIIRNIIFPIGNMFWYRPAALKPLFKLNLSSENIPQEPLHDETILHSIEHLLVYIAWNEEYAYRISLPSKIRDSNFIDLYRIYNTTNSLMRSFTYRIGRIILTLPRAVKLFFIYIISLVIKSTRSINLTK
jgi:rhamnosyltransferase